MFYRKMLKNWKLMSVKIGALEMEWTFYFSGAGRIAFTNQNSYMKAITDRYVQLSHGEVEKRVSISDCTLSSNSEEVNESF